MDSTSGWVQVTIAAAAFVAAALYLGGRFRAGLRRAKAAARRLEQLDQLLDMVEELLETVTKDMPALARNMGRVQASLAEMRENYERDARRLSRMARLGAHHHPESAEEFLRVEGNQ